MPRAMMKEPEDSGVLGTLAFSINSFSSWTKQILDFTTIRL